MRRPLEIAWKVTAIAAAAWVLDSLLFGLLLGDSSLGGQAAPPGQVGPLSFLATLILVASLVYPTLRSALAGARLAGALFMAVFGLNVFLVAIEGLVFLHSLPASDLILLALCNALTAALVALLLARTLGGATRPAEAGTVAADRSGTWWWSWRIALCSFGYLVLYTAAGMLIWPHVRWFYESEGLTPDPLVVFPLQIVRGALYVVFVLPLLRSLVMRRWQASLAMAAMFPVLAGAASLLIPNPVFPDDVRWLHLVEIAWSNFAYGALVGALLWNPAAGRRRGDAAAAASDEPEPEPAG
jgi:hypothetical protein